MPNQAKPTIVIFSAFYEPFEGGAERYVKEICQRLKNDYRFIILTSRISRKLAKKQDDNGVAVLRVGLGFKIDKYLFTLLAPLRAFFIKADLVQAVLESYAGLALFFYSWGKPTIPTLLTLQSGRVNMPKWLFKKIHKSADKIQAISKALAERAIAFGCGDVAVVPNGLDLAMFQSHTGFLRKPHQIVSVAHLKKVKGLNYLIEAMPDILVDFPEAKLVLLGAGPEEKNLKLQTANLKLQNAVIFKGKVSQAKVAKTLAESAIFVLPSLAEGLGIAVLEAMASGSPVVASSVDGILDIVKDKVNGVLVEPKKPEQISGAIIKLFSQPELARQLAQNAQKGLAKYDWQNIAQQIATLYQKILMSRYPMSSSPGPCSTSDIEH